MVPVGRPREFDEHQVLDRALRAFWTHGYEATSLVDLVEATGLKKGSLYQAFGDKHSLFLRALEHYLESGRSRVKQALRSADPLKGRLRQVLTAGCAEPQRGCFAVNCLVELAPHDPEVQTLLGQHFRQTEKLVAQAIERSLSTGDIELSVPPAQLARLLHVVMMGVAASAKGHLTGAQATATVDAALDALL